MPHLPRALLMCLLLGALLTACGKDEAAKPGGPGGRGGGPVPVVVETVAAQEWTDALRALGTVHAREAVTITAKVSETVQQVHFESGQQVARGAPLVTLSGQQQQAALASAEAALGEAEQLFLRQQQLVEQQLIARAALDAQRATRDAARAQVAQVRANLSDRVIRAPFAGVLGIRQVSPGALVTPGTPIATLDDVSRVFVDFPVPETELADVGPGQALVGRVATYGERSFDGTVATVSTRLDSASRAATVRGDFPNADGALKPGMLVEVSLSRGTRQALVVPEIAVQQIGSETFVWRVKSDDTVEKANVEVGGRVPGKVMLKAGVEAGQRIVTAGMGKLQAGATVAAAGAPPAAAK
ncbi:efflux RND transporter periplasmic adaptor subunit [Thermomonas sp.]|uniref:efflux RND transporter periplasmic adaptor subunit n=1 Tax=Thermomonas sp. TaxID=1971895 RepID=UPI001B6CC732|nr:efflux RND transporter periplasmic adaptor subunit [Thermomonas sp.]MBK6923882.1 efflux RND transporter periplasmic adaptor subunit [Thermomonas sp.]MBK9670015.1 efflux RND transporter periplasmic adaptor subunit [Thermomonas sp.]MBL0228796.1 efflux RND transporter periplasmic adaptor subunit [Thermomonas sp.]MBP6437957.1 efflux RND transporter periplasmic adaptor subunit [Thermomonas sp.]MBP7789240.1 efflux RND transporter periplasmic adaptor subunit [Thermomonas sp.]